MKVQLEQTTKYFTTQEVEALDLIAEIKESTDGEVTKQQIEMKNHKDYGQYFETTVKEVFTTSNHVLENGF